MKDSLIISSDTKVSKAPIPDKGRKEFKTTTDGLILRVSSTGSKSWIFKGYYNGSHQRITLGTASGCARGLSYQKAVLKAVIMRGDVQAGVNIKAKQVGSNNKKVTLRKVLDDYLSRHQDRLKKRTKSQYYSTIHLYSSEWLDKPLIQIDEPNVSSRHQDISEGRIEGQRNKSKAQADLWARILRMLFNFAINEYRGLNNEVLFTVPTRILSHNKQWHHVPRKQTHIRSTQLGAVLDGLDSYATHSPDDFHGGLMAKALLFAIFTGLRKNEILDLKWDRVDLENGYFWIAETKNGQPLELPISQTLSDILLDRLEYKHSAFVFGTPFNDVGRLVDPKKAIKRVVAHTGVDFGWHDCRRTFAGQAELAGLGSYTVKRLLNHKTRKDDVTAGYIVQSADELKKPAEKLEAQILRTAGRLEEATGIDEKLAEALNGLDEKKKRALLFSLLGNGGDLEVAI